MATNIITCSIPLELAKFLEENPQISPSKVLQTGLYKIQIDEIKLQEILKGLESRLARQSNRLRKLQEWLDEQGVTIPENVLE